MVIIVVQIDRRAASKVDVISVFHNGSLNGKRPPDIGTAPTTRGVFVIMGVAHAKLQEGNTHVKSEADLHLGAWEKKSVVSAVGMFLISFVELLC